MNSLLISIKSKNIQMFFSRLKYSADIRKKKYRNAQKARIYWQSVSRVIEKSKQRI